MVEVMSVAILDTSRIWCGEEEEFGNAKLKMLADWMPLYYTPLSPTRPGFNGLHPTISFGSP
jgi:hypothetical protein